MEENKLVTEKYAKKYADWRFDTAYVLGLLGMDFIVLVLLMAIQIF